MITVPAEKKLGRPVRQDDRQRLPLYDAEYEAVVSCHPLFRGLSTVQSYVDSILASVWWQNRFSHVRQIVVCDGRGRQRGIAGFVDGQGVPPVVGYLRLPRVTRYPWYILHEIAHVAAPPNAASHGVEFCNIYLSLVHRWLGRKSWLDLKEALDRRGVRWRLCHRV